MKIFGKSEQTDKPRRKHGCLWTLCIGIALYFGLSFLVGLMFGKYLESGAELTENTVYKLAMSGTLVEQGPKDDPFGDIFSQMPGNFPNKDAKVGLDDLLENIRLAKEDNRIKGIMLSGGNMSMGQASAKALREALIDFKESGKFLVAYADNYSQTNYYVVSVADQVLLNPVGSIDWNGLTSQKMYFKRALEKIGVEMQIIKVGTFKSAVEPFIRTSMSEADREQTMLYVKGIWDVMTKGVSESRNITVEQLNTLADRYIGLQSAEECVKVGLADSLIYAEQVDSLLRRLTDKKDYNVISTTELASVKRTAHKAKDKVAVLYAEGEINDDGNEGISAKRLRKQIKKIHDKKDVKAVVLRVNSPGGSATASEAIWYAIETLKEEGKPVVVSMGDLAASGGYYISSGANYIFAEENTLTGSIGIFGMIPSFAKLRDKVGIDIDGVSTNRYSDLGVNASYKGMSPEEYALMQKMVDAGYDLFTRRCAEGRHTTQDEIKKIAEGRVWLGKDALNLGLVDELGGINKAVVKAADLAQLGDYELVYYPEKKDFFTQMMESLDKSTPEERLIAKLRAWCSKSRVMAWIDIPEIK